MDGVDVDDVYVDFGLNVDCAIPMEATPFGSGATLSLSLEATRLIADETQREIAHGNSLPTQCNDPDPLDLKTIFHQICDLVAGDDKLKDHALQGLKEVHKSIMQEFCDAKPPSHDSSSMVSSNIPVEHLSVRKRKKGVCG